MSLLVMLLFIVKLLSNVTGSILILLFLVKLLSNFTGSILTHYTCLATDCEYSTANITVSNITQ